MGEDKMELAKQALATISYAFNGLPNVLFRITGFTSDVGIVKDIPLKKFKSKFNLKKLECLKAIGGNQDGHNIRNATKRLRKYGNKRKLLIVISDGQPAYSCGIDDTIKAVKEAKQNHIQVIGLGIKGATLKTLKVIYPDKHYMFENNDNLVDDLTNIILGCLNGNKKQTQLIKNKWRED